MESSDPENQEVQRMLNDVVLDEKFNLERFKYSRNYEASAFFEKYNIGAKVSVNLIKTVAYNFSMSGYSYFD